MAGPKDVVRLPEGALGTYVRTEDGVGAWVIGAGPEGAIALALGADAPAVLEVPLPQAGLQVDPLGRAAGVETARACAKPFSRRRRSFLGLGPRGAPVTTGLGAVDLLAPLRLGDRVVLSGSGLSEASRAIARAFAAAGHAVILAGVEQPFPEGTVVRADRSATRAARVFAVGVAAAMAELVEGRGAHALLVVDGLVEYARALAQLVQAGVAGNLIWQASVSSLFERAGPSAATGGSITLLVLADDESEPVLPPDLALAEDRRIALRPSRHGGFALELESAGPVHGYPLRGWGAKLAAAYTARGNDRLRALLERPPGTAPIGELVAGAYALLHGFTGDVEDLARRCPEVVSAVPRDGGLSAASRAKLDALIGA